MIILICFFNVFYFNTQAMWTRAYGVWIDMHKKQLAEVDKACADARLMELRASAVIHSSERELHAAFFESLTQAIKRCAARPHRMPFDENKRLIDDVQTMKKVFADMEYSQDQHTKSEFGKLLEWGEENCEECDEPCCCEEPCNEE